MKWATVLTDASYCPRTQIAGWAGWIKIDGQEAIRRYGPLKATKVAGSAEAEMYAVLNGIWIALQAGAEAILVRTDCDAVIKAATISGGRGKLGKLWHEATQRPDLKPARLEFRHIKGHGEIKCRASWVNDWCDKHAKKAMKEARREYDRSS